MANGVDPDQTAPEDQVLTVGLASLSQKLQFLRVSKIFEDFYASMCFQAALVQVYRANRCYSDRQLCKGSGVFAEQNLYLEGS